MGRPTRHREPCALEPESKHTAQFCVTSPGHHHDTGVARNPKLFTAYVPRPKVLPRTEIFILKLLRASWNPTSVSAISRPLYHEARLPGRRRAKEPPGPLWPSRLSLAHPLPRRSRTHSDQRPTSLELECPIQLDSRYPMGTQQRESVCGRTWGGMLI